MWGRSAVAWAQRPAGRGSVELDRTDPPPALVPGVSIVACRTGRYGTIRSVIAPGRAGRTIYVMWEGTFDLALVRPDEIALAGPRLQDEPRRTRRFLWVLPRD